MILAFEPRQNCVAREIIGPSFQGGWNFNAQLRRFMKNRRAGVWSENVGPELCPGEFLAYIHHEIDSLPPFLRALSGKSEDDVEGRNHTRLDAALSRLVDISEHLKILVH